jgi:hypothetical protein
MPKEAVCCGERLISVRIVVGDARLQLAWKLLPAIHSVKITTGEIQSPEIGILARSLAGIQPLRF